jgi:hypothetical protein
VTCRFSAIGRHSRAQSIISSARSIRDSGAGRVANGASSLLSIDGVDNTGTIGTNAFNNGNTVNMGDGLATGGQFTEIGVWAIGFTSGAAGTARALCSNQQAYWATPSCGAVTVSMTLSVASGTQTVTGGTYTAISNVALAQTNATAPFTVNVQDSSGLLNTSGSTSGVTLTGAGTTHMTVVGPLSNVNTVAGGAPGQFGHRY